MSAWLWRALVVRAALCKGEHLPEDIRAEWRALPIREMVQRVSLYMALSRQSVNRLREL